MITANNLRFSWPDQALLNIPQWQVAAGETVFLSGASGSGKSTLLALLAGLMPPTQGELTVAGARLDQLNQRQRDRWRAKHLGVIFQQFNLLPYLSALDNILLGARFRGLPLKEARPSAIALAHQLALDDSLLVKPASQLSTGQQQRVAAVRALIGAPEVLIADEPTSALDDARRDHFMQLLLQQSQEQGTTVIFVSHDLRLARHFQTHIPLHELNEAAVCSPE